MKFIVERVVKGRNRLVHFYWVITTALSAGRFLDKIKITGFLGIIGFNCSIEKFKCTESFVKTTARSFAISLLNLKNMVESDGSF